ncbi:pollen-specific leucine-rich repeat extensin-like protein 1 isoform X2 [Pararge aegeria]|uniref:pollen-specific leucine-rich repeat extensin-like protein 1 isoform X2 n=1 Tax=Pararge aegeria TaxID=116150 RepID=UPI0019D15729|nr:pollen-specific leucine-rich repeat extensin-like protein 1 isoform X2 [Pararge aegeria]
MSNNAHELSNRLLNALDSNYNVVDMQTVNEIISILEKFNITKELLETTRLGKHVNELRRKTADPTLARRAKVLVKRWRDLVIPVVASPAHTGSNRSSAERQVRRLGGTPLTSPALSRQVVSPAVSSPRPLSRPAWGGYESDSQDVILVDDDPPPPPPPTASALAPPTPLAHKPIIPLKRPPSPEPLYDEKKAKRDKKPKKRRGHSRAGSGTEASGGEASPHSHAHAPAGAAHAWGARNGSGPERRRNGLRRDPADPYAALVNRLPPAGAKKVKTTRELLEQIQSRGKAPSRAASPASPASPDVMLIEDASPITIDSPLRNGGTEPKQEPEPKPEPIILPPLEEEREWADCTCEEEESDNCPAAVRTALRPLHVRALHNALLPGLNGTRAPVEPHKFAVRSLTLPDQPDLFSSVVPLYNYSDYADDYCVKNMARVPLCTHIPWSDFAPRPPSPPPPKSPPPLRPYPSPIHEGIDVKLESTEDVPEAKVKEKMEYAKTMPVVEAEMVGIPTLEPSERLKAPLLSIEDEKQFDSEQRVVVKVEKKFVSVSPEHRTVERTKEDLDGRMLYSLCETAIRTVPFNYEQTAAAPIVTLPPIPEVEGSCDPSTEVQACETLDKALEEAAESTGRDSFGRPVPPTLFAEWHECARLGELIALPYVVID